MSEINLMCGDCLERMKELPDNSVDLIICDLPYGTTNINWDKVINFDSLWKEYNRVAKENANIVLFSSTSFTFKLYESNPKQYKYKLIWKKNVPTGMSSAKRRPMRYYEEILVFQKGKDCTYNPQMKERVGEGKACYRFDHYCGENSRAKYEKIKKRYDPDWVQPSDVLEFDVVPNRKGKLHPTQKPVELLEWLINTYSNEGEVVLDSCMGSGTTGVACINTNRNFIGIELDEEYFEVAKNRINDAQNSKNV